MKAELVAIPLIKIKIHIKGLMVNEAKTGGPFGARPSHPYYPRPHTGCGC